MKIKPFSSKTKQRKQWNEIQLENLVCDFYQQDDISRQAPDKDDVMVVRNPGESKSKKQKHQLQMLVLEAYLMWKDRKIGKSKLA